nr:hypothetical protein [Tanacetum cinerariifolium]
PSEEHEPEDDDEDSEEDPNEEHESKGSEETELFEEDEIAITPPPSRHRGARISRQSAEDLAVTQMMRIHTLEARARADTVEDADSGSLMCTKFLADETKKVDKYISGLPDNIHGNVMSARPNTLDEIIELANDLMDQKLRTYAERQNESKRKANDSPRN